MYLVDNTQRRTLLQVHFNQSKPTHFSLVVG